VWQFMHPLSLLTAVCFTADVSITCWTGLWQLMHRS